MPEIRFPAEPPPMTAAPPIGEPVFEHVLPDPRTRARYYHWDKLRFLRAPGGISTEQWWWALKILRAAQWRTLPLRDTRGRHFSLCIPDAAAEMLHRIDKGLAGQIGAGEVITQSSAMRDRYILTSLMEEAITSSQLEGAATTREVAKEMIRSGRAPRDVSEQMILNNFHAMERVRAVSHQPLTPEMVLELHGLLTRDTLRSQDEGGRLQAPADQRVAVWSGNRLLHAPPPAEQLEARMKAMCSFANGETGEGFVHPVARAIVLHFWLAYDHPFADGNGRTARALFYWSLLRQGYWLAEFIAISRILRRAPVKYARAFLYTETDDNDLTYFLLHQLEVITEALRDLDAYIARKTAEVRETQALLRQASALNHRQLALISHALRHPDFTYTVASHQRSHGTVYQTARTDLLDLAAKGLLVHGKQGKAFVFRPAPALADRLRSLGTPMRRAALR